MPLKLSELRPTEGSRKKTRRVGRGPGSTRGKTSGKGHKGQRARSGSSLRPGYEGGQTPLYMRTPKKGFNNYNKKVFSVVNIKTLEERFADEEQVTPEVLKSRGIVKNLLDGVKLLGEGKLSKKLTVKVNACSNSAKEKVEAAGGQVEVI